MNINREELVNLLKKTEVVVTFTKIDGTEREMHCTLQSHRLPIRSETEEKNNKERVTNDSILSVFDLAKQQWRSFRLDSVKSYEKL